MYKITKLNNGAQVATLSVGGAHSVSIGVWVGTGSRYEPEPLSGISHFFEHMVFKGTKNRSYLEIKQSIEGRGGTLNAFTSEEVTCLLAKVLSSHAHGAIDVLLDMLFNPLLRDEDLEKERRVIYEEIKMYVDLPQHRAYEGLLKLLWPRHPLGRNIIGDFKTLKNISREQLIKYRQRNCGWNNVLIAGCGKITHTNMVKYVKDFIRKNKFPQDKQAKLEYKPITCRPKRPKAKFIIKDTKQSHICLGVPALRRTDPKRYAASFLHIILGANMSSRLFNKVREEKGLAYEISTAVKRLKDTGAFVIHAGVVSEKVEQALAVILNELKQISKKTVRIDEFKRAREYYIGQLMMGLEDNADHMAWLAESLMHYGRVRSIKQVIAQINKVKIKDLTTVARMIFKKKNLNLSVIGPLTKEQKKGLLRILNSF